MLIVVACQGSKRSGCEVGGTGTETGRRGERGQYRRFGVSESSVALESRVIGDLVQRS
jgi:hypothetical protein